VIRDARGLAPEVRRLAWAVWVGVAASPLACAGQADVATAAGGPPAPLREVRPCTVTRIVDGDTLDCVPLGRVRLIGMDAPERGQAPFGAAAAEALAALIPESGEILLEADVDDRDQYDRALRYVWIDGRLANWVLVRTGYAVLLTYPPNVQYVESLIAAQAAAREEAAGLWDAGGFACPPQEYRRGSCR
jgi:micrococcal nuclease